MQPTAQAVGLLSENGISPNGAKDSASYICKLLAAFDFQQARPASQQKTFVSGGAFWRSSKRTTWLMTGNTFGVSFCRPFRGFSVIDHHPRLTPWAAFLRRFAAGFLRALRTQAKLVTMGTLEEQVRQQRTSGVPLARHQTNASLSDSSTCFLGNKKWTGRDPDSLPETHGHNRRTLVTQPEIFKTPGGILAARIRAINGRLVAVAVAVSFKTKKFALMQVKERSRAARIGALRKHFRRSLGRGNVAG
jgi:hypothetical protein